MDAAGHQSFDVRKYMTEYKKRMMPTVRAAMNEGVHYGNILTIPAYCVGDIAHHIDLQHVKEYNGCHRGVTEVMGSTLDNSLDSLRTCDYLLSRTLSADYLSE